MYTCYTNIIYVFYIFIYIKVSNNKPVNVCSINNNNEKDTRVKGMSSYLQYFSMKNSYENFSNLSIYKHVRNMKKTTTNKL